MKIYLNTFAKISATHSKFGKYVASFVDNEINEI